VTDANSGVALGDLDGDGRPDDCDGEVDEEAIDAVEFCDADGDGQGDPGAIIFARRLTAGLSPNGDDCDDGCRSRSSAGKRSLGAGPPPGIPACRDVAAEGTS
jgi:hypothetical protein